jgi:hypothetical protein
MHDTLTVAVDYSTQDLFHEVGSLLLSKETELLNAIE